MIVITGPARSGTSLVAQLAGELGADFGDRSQLLPADQWNERGYFESREINDVNHRLVFGESLPAAWEGGWSTRRFDAARRVLDVALAPVISRPAAVRRRAAQLQPMLRDVASAYRNRVAKDPRFVFSLPVWEQLGAVDCVVYSLRHPFEVASSIRAKSGVPMRAALFVWQRWSMRFWRHPPSVPIVVIDYNALFDAGRRTAELARLSAVLGQPCDPRQAERILDGCAEPRLRHAAGEGHRLPGSVARYYDELLAYHARHDGRELAAATGTPRTRQSP